MDLRIVFLCFAAALSSCERVGGDPAHFAPPPIESKHWSKGATSVDYRVVLHPPPHASACGDAIVVRVMGDRRELASERREFTYAKTDALFPFLEEPTTTVVEGSVPLVPEDLASVSDVRIACAAMDEVLNSLRGPTQE